MPNMNKRLATSVGFAIFCTVGCTASTNFNEGGHPPPNGWSAMILGDSGECPSIDGDYQNFGVGRQAREEVLVQTRLDVALGHAFTPIEVPKLVGITFDEESNMLNYQFQGSVSQNYSTPVVCSDGWYTWTKTMTNKYLGDGTNLDYSIRKTELTKASDGDLIVHLNLEVQSSSFWFLKSQDKRETWSKYGASKNNN